MTVDELVALLEQAGEPLDYREVWPRLFRMANCPPELMRVLVSDIVRDDERLVYELVTELLETHQLAAITYERAIAAMGLEHTIELVTGIGIYSTICMLLRAFDVTVPEGERQLP